MTGLTIAVAGLGFGEDFVPIYLSHPDVATVVLIEADQARLATAGDRFAIAETDRFSNLAVALTRNDIDAVHIATPVRFHADHVVEVLAAGKHCACAVPMAMTLSDIDRIIDAQRASGRTYMMMETMVYGREYLYAQELHRSGALGEITYYEGFHLQNLDGFPSYWMGYPPMAYVTHALSPILGLTGSRVHTVRALGTGRLAPHQLGDYGNPFPTETGFFELDGTDAVAQVTMSFFGLARSYREGFSVYGDRIGLEWPTLEGDPLHEFELADVPAGGRGRQVAERLVSAPDTGALLPASIAGFTRPTTFSPPGKAPIAVGAGHSGSHPHLVHEFVSSIVDGRRPAIDTVRAAEFTAPGICAHTSALAGGDSVAVPDYRR
jgi:predicted dehydrogenase